MALLEIKLLIRWERIEMANNYIVIDNSSANVQRMLRPQGEVDQNSAFRKKWQNSSLLEKESGKKELELKMTDQKNSTTTVKLIIDIDGTIIVND
jgi:hypothetical protein